MSPIRKFEGDEGRLLLESKSARQRYVLESMWKCGLLGAGMGLVISALLIAHNSGLMHILTASSLKTVCVFSFVTSLFFALVGLSSAHEELENLLKQKRWAEDYNSFRP